jgi:hypothetical protein
VTRSGDFKPGQAGGWPPASPGLGGSGGRVRATPTPSRVALALASGLLAALAWAMLRGILDLSVGLLVVAGAGGWGIGAACRGSSRGRPLAGSLGLAAWLASLVLTWLVTRLVLPGSGLGLLERLGQTGFLEYTSQQAGVLELASLALFVGAALVSASPSRARRPG